MRPTVSDDAARFGSFGYGTARVALPKGRVLVSVRAADAAGGPAAMSLAPGLAVSLVPEFGRREALAGHEHPAAAASAGVAASGATAAQDRAPVRIPFASFEVPAAGTYRLTVAAAHPDGARIELGSPGCAASHAVTPLQGTVLAGVLIALAGRRGIRLRAGELIAGRRGRPPRRATGSAHVRR